MKTKLRAIKLLTLTVAVLLLCTGVLTLYVRGKSGAPTDGNSGAKEAVYAITNIPVNEVAALAITNRKTRFGLLIKGEELEVVSDVQGSYSLTELRSLIYAAAHLTGSRKITDMASAGQYGMENPLASISIIKTDGTQVDLSLLSQNPMDENYYLYAEAEQAVYLIPANVAELFMRQETDFFNHTVLPVINASALQNIDWINMDYGGGGRNYRIEQKNGSFSLAAPISQKLTALSVMQKLIMPLSALYSDEFVEAGADLTGYGFDEYTLRVDMSCGGQQYTALLLDTGDGTCLMADEITGDVYKLGTESLMPLMNDYRELLDGKVFTYAAGDLKSVEISGDSSNLLAEFSGEKGAGKKAAGERGTDGTGIDGTGTDGTGTDGTGTDGTGTGEAAISLLAVLNDAEIASEVPGEMTSSGEQKFSGELDKEPVLTLTFTMQSGSIDVIELIPAALGGYFVSINETVNFTTTERYAEAVKKAVAEY